MHSKANYMKMVCNYQVDMPIQSLKAHSKESNIFGLVLILIFLLIFILYYELLYQIILFILYTIFIVYYFDLAI
jgi:hypothetical protein